MTHDHPIQVALPPFGNLYDLRVYVERALDTEETIVFQAGSHADTMSMRFADFVRLADPTLGEFATHI